MRESDTKSPSVLLSRNTGLLLTIGFGGLLLLMAVAGLDAVRVLHSIQSRNDEIRREFLARNRLLNQIRSDLYLSGTYMRDYLLEPEPSRADAHKASLDKSRTNMEAALQAYAAHVAATEVAPYGVLRRELRSEMQVHVNGIRDLAQNCVRVVRNMALLLRPSMLDDFGLVPALEWQAREVSKGNGHTCQRGRRRSHRESSRRTQNVYLPRSCKRPCTTASDIQAPEW